jgi:hypothetical protein
LPDPSTKPPGHLIGTALTTDTDNTGGATEAWCGDVVLEG